MSQDLNNSFPSQDLPELCSPAANELFSSNSDNDETVRTKRVTIEGCLYVMTSSWMPVDHYKIGLSSNLNARLGQYATSHLEPKFILTSPACVNPNAPFKKGENEPATTLSFIYYRETAVHQILQKYRCTSNREFFKCKLEEVQQAFDKVEKMNDLELVAFITNTKYIIPDSSNNLQAKLDKATQELDAAQKTIASLSTTVQSFLLEQSKTGKAFLTVENNNLKTELEKVKKEINRLTDKLDSGKGNEDKFKKEKEDLKTKFEKEKEKLKTKFEKEKEDLKKEFEKEKDELKKEFEKEKEELKKEIKKLNEIVVNQKDTIQSLRKALEEKIIECEKVKREKTQLEKQVKKLQDEVDAYTKNEKKTFDIDLVVEPKYNYNLPTCNKLTTLLDAWKEPFLMGNSKSSIFQTVNASNGERKVGLSFKNYHIVSNFDKDKEKLSKSLRDLFDAVYGEIKDIKFTSK